MKKGPDIRKLRKTFMWVFLVGFFATAVYGVICATVLGWSGQLDGSWQCISVLVAICITFVALLMVGVFNMVLNVGGAKSTPPVNQT